MSLPSPDIDFTKVLEKIKADYESSRFPRTGRLDKELTLSIKTNLELLKLFPLTPDLTSLSVETVNKAMAKCAYDFQSILATFYDLIELRIDNYLQYISDPQNAQLLEALILKGNAKDKICESFYKATKLADTGAIENPYTKISYARAIQTLIRRNPNILITNKAFSGWVTGEWNNLLSLDSIDDVHVSTYHFSDIVTSCYMMLCLLPETGPDEVFNLILGLDSPGTSLSKVIIQETINAIKSTFNIERKRAAIVRFLEIYKDASIPSKNKLLLVSCFINPLLAHCVKNDEVIIDARLGEALLTDVVGKDNLAEATQGYLELGGLVVEQLYKLDNVPSIIEEFGENATQALLSRNLSDQGIQTGRYLLVSRLCNEKKPNIIKSILILKILFSLLKIGSIEDKALIDEAVDNLLPITFHCMKSDPVLKDNFFAHLETLLNDDSMQRSRIFRLLLKYPNFFYIKHEMFTKHIINLSNARNQQDAKRFNYDLTNLLVTWEKIRMYPESYTEPIEIENNHSKDKGIFNGIIEMLHQEPEEPRAWSERNGNNFLHLIVKLYIAALQHQQQNKQQKQPTQDIASWINSHEFALASNILKKLVMLFPKDTFSDTFYPKGIEVKQT